MSTNKNFKNETIGLIDEMIKHADKGPSGFWTDDYEGCGNPEIFPEFNEGLKYGKQIQKNHYLCPWNTAILFGDGYGNITTGCYHSCSFREVKYLPTEMLKAVLSRFRKNLVSGKYDNLERIKPLLTIEEQAYIEKRKEIEAKERERHWKEEEKRKAKAATSLIQKYQNNEVVKALLIDYYGDDAKVLSEYGCIDFSPTGMKNVVGGERLSYDDYIDIQIQSSGKQRDWFEMCYYNLPSEFKGCIEKKTQSTVCFKRIFVTGMYPDDCSFFDGKEDHVWMDIKGFEQFQVGDSVSFFAEVYRYLKTGNGRLIDYSLRNPDGIKRIEAYELPSDDELMLQGIDQIICESCYLLQQCSRMFCIRDRKEISALRKQMLEMMKSGKNEENRPEGKR